MKKRKCKDCKEEKLLDKFYVNCRGDIYTRCIECEKAFQKQRYKENRNKILIQKREYRAANKEKTLELARKSRKKRKPVIDAKREKQFIETPHNTKKRCGGCGKEKFVVDFYKGDSKYGRHSICIECQKANKKTHYWQNKEDLKDRRDKDREKLRKKAREYYRNNKEKIREKIKKYNEDNKEKVIEYRRLYNQNNPHHRFNSRARRRALIEGAKITTKEWKLAMASTGWKCFYCNTELTKDNRSLDHVLPLNLGGLHHISNLVPSCRSCNSSKSDRELEQWKPFHKLSESKQNYLKKIVASQK